MVTKTDHEPLIRRRINTTCNCDFQYGTVSDVNTTTRAIGYMLLLVNFQRTSRRVLLSVTTQLFEIDDSSPAIFQSKQAFLLQPLQALVGILPGQA